MCGICGIISSRKETLQEETLRSMCGKLTHRGPDDQGIYLNGISPQVGLGHRRLSIIDLTPAGHQPMSNEDGTVWIVLNGEIYNFHALKTDLQKKGHCFKSSTDTETVIHLYEEYQEQCLRFLRGMFAFAIWDSKRKKLFIARDRVGKKPLVYSHVDGLFAFSSELASLLESGVTKRDIDPAAIDHYLTFGYVPAPMSIYRNVFKLPPAHFLVMQDSKVHIERYWELDSTKKIAINEHDAEAETLRILKESVKMRLFSDVPLGAFLSGGVDSSVVVALMSELSSTKVKTFSIGFEDRAYNELGFAKEVADRFGTEHHELIVKPQALDILGLLVDRYGEPYADSSCIPTYYVANQTRKFVTVALNGDGGDELFAGYERYQGMLAAETYRRMPFAVRSIAQAAAKMLPDSLDQKNRLRNIKRFFNAAELSAADRYLRWVGIFDATTKGSLYSGEFISNSLPHRTASLELITPYFSGAGKRSLLDTLLKLDTETYLPNDLLVKVDITSMANSLEARSPFLDHVLMEFVATLPAGFKINGSCKKYLLKKIGSRLLPKKNLYRRKMGFGIPLGAWLRNELNSFMQDTLLSKKALARGYFNEETVRSMVLTHTKGTYDHAYRLWALLMLEVWHQRFID